MCSSMFSSVRPFPSCFPQALCYIQLAALGSDSSNEVVLSGIGTVLLALCLQLESEILRA